ncbi:T9SS type A sorting domain-containing protein [Flavobacterium macrobrachii]|uniref:T9SS type A sorting domain-containing protein n=3 Tax=Flavobacterium macrobrachii TaxID=591204 RepID=A0ABS2CT75_9FLAO|nr:T9SS type A sorting domain-containing protein [Flavobacterium macrobrachii]MBM6498170.1 T9SS type A sorting domain-containing protein [Flavobacterium macrobrachii]
MQPNGGLLVGGSFKSFQGVTERSLVRLTNQSFLDVNTNEPTQKIFLYPNPTKDILHFSDINENIKYQITNLFGQLVQKGVVVNKQVSTESLQNGMYIIEIQNGTQKNRYKFLKQL